MIFLASSTSRNGKSHTHCAGGIALFFFSLLVALALACSPATWAHQTHDEPSHFRARIVRVEAGDRVVVRLQTWDVTIQLHGVSCPVRPPEARERAREYTSRRVLNTDADIEVRGTGARATIYGEVIAADGRSLNQELVRVGLAMWARAYAPGRNDLSLLQTEARNARRGIWSDPTAANVPLPTPHPTPTPTPQHAATTPHPTPTPPPATPAPTPRPTVKPTPTPTPTRRFSPPPSPHFTPKSPLQKAPSAEPPKVPTDSRLVAAAIFAGIVALLTAAVIAGTGVSLRRLPFQIGAAMLAAIGVTLLLPLLLGAISSQPNPHSQTSSVSLVAVLPPIIVLFGWAAVALPRREQILRGATERTLSHISDPNVESADTTPFGPGLMRVGGVAEGLFREEPFISAVGAIPAIYLHEVTQIFEAAEHAPGQPPRQRRYVWRTIHNETRVGDFLLADPSSEASPVVVETARAQFHTRHVARFYNEVPVQQWFARPYPGDTRTEVTYISPDAPLVVWGRVRRMPSADSSDEYRIVFDGLQELLVVAEGDGTIVWTRRPLLGLLLTLVTICLTVLCAYIAASTPSAPLPAGSPRPFALGETAGLLCFWAGASLLLSLTLKARAALGALRKLTRQWTTLGDVLERRRERLFALFSRDNALIEHCRSAEHARFAIDQIAAEAEIDERLRAYLAGGTLPLSSAANQDDVRVELLDWQGRVATAAARYNDAVRTVALLRRSFPTGLLLRARDRDDPPPYGL